MTTAPPTVYIAIGIATLVLLVQSVRRVTSKTFPKQSFVDYLLGFRIINPFLLVEAQVNKTNRGVFYTQFLGFEALSLAGKEAIDWLAKHERDGKYLLALNTYYYIDRF
jgi:hypothetical protein